jgi:putative membrane protein
MPAPLLPVLHTSTAPVDLMRAWHLDPPLTALLVTAAAAYLIAWYVAPRHGRRRVSRWRVLAYLAGLEVIAVALMGPPDHGNGARFSVHMVQHTLLMLVAPPLLVLGQPGRVILRGLPAGSLRWFAQQHQVRSLLAVSTQPAVVFLAATVPFVLWHYPPLYEAAVRDPLVHELEHLTFFLGSLLFWVTLADALPAHCRLRATAKMLLTFAVWMATDLVCAAVTLAPRPLYRVYEEAAALWGFDPLADQRLGGAIMWVAGGGLYAAVLVGLLVRSTRPERRTVRLSRGARAPECLLFPAGCAGARSRTAGFPRVQRGGIRVRCACGDGRAITRRSFGLRAARLHFRDAVSGRGVRGCAHRGPTAGGGGLSGRARRWLVPGIGTAGRCAVSLARLSERRSSRFVRGPRCRAVDRSCRPR